jgi:HD-like signal output (HDOD) protein
MPQAEPTPGLFPRDAILAASRSLGVLGGSHAAPRVLAAVCAPGADAAEVARVVGQEPGLTARVLRVANSAFYGLPRGVATLDRAIVVLGLDAVRGVAAAACLDRGMLRLPDASPVDLDELIRHSVAAATAAQALARRHHRALAGEAFIGGLLHDFGVIVQLRLNPGGVAGLAAALRAAPGSPRAALELEHVGVSHGECAATVFEAWNLPGSLVDSARRHHDAGTPDPLTALVHLGDHVAVAAGIAFAGETAADPPGDALAALGLEEADLATAADGLPGRVAELQRALAAA